MKLFYSDSGPDLKMILTRITLACFLSTLCFLNTNGLMAQGGSEVLILSKKTVNFSEDFIAKLYDKLDELKKDKGECKSSSCLARVLHYEGSILFNLDRSVQSLDVIRSKLDSALFVDQEWTCNTLMKFAKMDSLDRVSGSPLIYYPIYFDSIWWDRSVRTCQTRLSKESFDRVVEDTMLDKLLVDLLISDQLFRAGSDFLSSRHYPPEQNSLDSLNRLILDELYLIFPDFEDSVSQRGWFAIWHILHHSKDCQWNSKWLKILFKATESGAYNGAWLKKSMKRFYQPGKGCCVEYGAELIDFMRLNYSVEHGVQFGYHSF